jgi:hypothetical protein
VLIVIRKEIAECTLGPCVDCIAHGWNVALGISGIAKVIVRCSVEDAPILGDAVNLLVLVVVSLDDRGVELGCRFKGCGFAPIRPILDVGLIALQRVGIADCVYAIGG